MFEPNIGCHNLCHCSNCLINASLSQLTFKVLVLKIDTLGHFYNCTITAQWEGMGDVGSVSYEPALLPPMPAYKGFKLQ